jgi:DMSO reductase family type II enzyme chaperone
VTVPAPDHNRVWSPADWERLGDAIGVTAGARGAVYAVAATVFTEPTEALYRALDSGDLAGELSDLLDRTGLDVEAPDLALDDEREILSARYNDLFVVGYSEVVDRTDGTVQNYGPPVSLYESDYRPEASWNDVNLDLARAYEHFGLEVDQESRRNHDHVRLQLEFMGYLCRREAAVDPDVAAARLDFHDRHLRVVTTGVAEALDSEPGTGVYGEFADFLDRFTAADVADLDRRLNGGGES